MLTKEQLGLIHTRLVDKMLGKLNMRWRKSGAYIPPGGHRVHIVAPLDERDQQDFDVYLAAYRDAIEDFMEMLNPEQAQLNSLVATMPPHMIRMADCRPDLARSGVRSGRVSRKPAKDKGARRKSEARRKAEALFKKGSGDG